MNTAENIQQAVEFYTTEEGFRIIERFGLGVQMPSLVWILTEFQVILSRLP